MHNESQETASDHMGDVRTGIEAADDTGMVSNQVAIHEVGDAETASDERDTADAGVERA